MTPPLKDRGRKARPRCWNCRSLIDAENPRHPAGCLWCAGFGDYETTPAEDYADSHGGAIDPRTHPEDYERANGPHALRNAHHDRR